MPNGRIARLKSGVASALRRTDAGTFLVGARELLRRGYLAEVGWLRSFEAGQAVDADGAPIPWYTYPAIHFLEERVPWDEPLRVFEYGCGNSSMWWSARGGRVTSVEHHGEWVATVRRRVDDRVTVRERPLGDGYVDAILEDDERYDVVVVDGRMRVRCAAVAAERLTDRGVLLWDNAERVRYRPGIDALHEAGFRRVDFDGLAPIGWNRTRTSVFYRGGNLLGL